MGSADSLPPSATANGDVGFDPAALQQKYALEREKRLKNGGPQQYHHSRPSDLDSMLKDPYVAPGFTRDSVTAEYDIVIIGAGYTGIQIAARLMMKGHTNLCIIEKGGDVGGTWYAIYTSDPTNLCLRETEHIAGIGIAILASNVTSTRTYTCPFWKTLVSCRRESTYPGPNYSSTAGTYRGDLA